MKPSMPPFQDARLLVVGDVMLDRYWHGDASRISPEAPVPVVRVGKREDRPGGAGNVALNIAALGSAATLVGVVGNDDTAGELQARLEAAGVYCKFSRSAGKPTITKLRVIGHQQQLIRLDFEERFSPEDIPGLPATVARLLPDADALLLSDYDKGALDQVEQLIALGGKLGIPVVVDPKGKDFGALSRRYPDHAESRRIRSRHGAQRRRTGTRGKRREDDSRAGAGSPADHPGRAWHDADPAQCAGVAFARQSPGSL